MFGILDSFFTCKINSIRFTNFNVKYSFSHNGCSLAVLFFIYIFICDFFCINCAVQIRFYLLRLNTTLNRNQQKQLLSENTKCIYPMCDFILKKRILCLHHQKDLMVSALGFQITLLIYTTVKEKLSTKIFQQNYYEEDRMEP